MLCRACCCLARQRRQAACCVGQPTGILLHLRQRAGKGVDQLVKRAANAGNFILPRQIGAQGEIQRMAGVVHHALQRAHLATQCAHGQHRQHNRCQGGQHRRAGRQGRPLSGAVVHLRYLGNHGMGKGVEHALDGFNPAGCRRRPDLPADAGLCRASGENFFPQGQCVLIGRNCANCQIGIAQRRGGQ